MRKLIFLAFVTLDGVMQSDDGPEVDPSGGFTYGGWSTPFFDDFLDQTLAEQQSKPFDFVLGRKTYEQFAAFWPYQTIDKFPLAERINNARKYVASTSLQRLDWSNSTLLQGDVVQEIKQLKQQDGPILQVSGSSHFLQTLLAHDLLDELYLYICPITLGMGKRVFGEGTIPAAFTLREVKTSPRGVIIASYERAGKVQTG
ncbi:MAG TPA: dihydrofolate reductase family protein [Ktedonobacterales bacterium]|jgi:dihydrofolate reductase